MIRVYWIATRRAYTTSLELNSEAFDACLATFKANMTSLEVNSVADESLVRLAFVRSERAKTHDVVVLLLTVGRAEHPGKITETVRFIHLQRGNWMDGSERVVIRTLVELIWVALGPHNHTHTHTHIHTHTHTRTHTHTHTTR
jgi:hypothetical protein